MIFEGEAIDTPIRFNKAGVALIGSTRVLSPSVIWNFNQGERPEDIVDMFSTLSLAEVYAVIAYYLLHGEQVDAYLDHQRKVDDQLRDEIESRHPELEALKARLSGSQQTRR